jgi:quercetin dioxygenase-like cupin family protein
MKSKWVWALLIAALATAALAGNVLATTSTAPPPTILGKAQFDAIDLNAHTIPADLWQARLRTLGQSDVYVVDNKLPVGSSTGWHSHPGPSMILVVAGTVTNYLGDDPTCTGHSYSQGQGFIDQGGEDVHILRNEGNVPAETIAVQLLPKGAARKIDKPDPGNCHF